MQEEETTEVTTEANSWLYSHPFITIPPHLSKVSITECKATVLQSLYIAGMGSACNYP